MDFLSLNIRGIKDCKKVEWVNKLLSYNQIEFLCLQETYHDQISDISISNLWGNRPFNFADVKAHGKSGGIICVWDPSKFKLTNSFEYQNVLIVSGFLVGDLSPINIANVYAPQAIKEKKKTLEFVGQF